MREYSLPHPVIKKLTEVILLSGVVAAPLIVLPIFANFVVTSKLLVLFISAIFLAAIFIWQTIRTQAISIPRSPIILPLTIFGLVGLISSLLTTQYPTENLLGMGGVYIATAVVAVVGGQFLRNRSSELFMTTFTIAATLLAITTVQEHFGYGPSFLINQVLPLNIPGTGVFSLSGALFIASEIMGIAALSTIVTAVIRRKVTLLQGISLPLILIGLGFAIFGQLPGKAAHPNFLAPTASWQIAVDSLKSPRTALVGFGPENFADAFQRFKPVTLNTTQWWSSVVGQGSNVPLTLVPTLGLLGLGAWVFLVIRIMKQTSLVVKTQPGLVTVVLTTIVLQLVAPTSPVLWWMLGIALAFLIANRENQRQTIVHLMKFSYLDPENDELRQGVAKLAPVAIPAVLSLVVVGALLWPLGRAYAASHYFFRGILAQQQNDFLGMYSNQQQATLLNRYISGYRSNYAITSLTAANALLAKEGVTDQEKKEASTLIQQAVNEARASTALRPNDAQTWQVLGQVYATLIPYQAEGADQWATLAYTQAIQNNPTNPLLRLQFGTVLFNLKNYQDAVVLFEQAYNLKNDLPSAAYSLATAYRAVQQPERAQAAYQRTLQLLDPDSEDYKKAQADLEAVTVEVDKLKAAAQAKPTPRPAPVPVAPSVVNENVTQSSDQAVEEPKTTQTDLTPDPTASDSAGGP